MGEQWKQRWGLSSWAPKSLQMVTAAVKLKDAPPWKKSYDTPRPRIKKQRHCFANKGPSSQRYGFSSSHIWMWELDHKEGRALKNWCFWTVVLEKTLESPLDYKKIKPVDPKGNQPWIFIGRTDAEAEAQYFGHLMQRVISLEKTLGLRKMRAGGEGVTEDEMVGWHHRLNGPGFKQTPGDSEGQGSLVCCSPSGHKELAMTEWLNNNNNMPYEA